MDNEVPLNKIISVASLIFTGARALAYIQRQVIETGDKEMWDGVLDQVSEWLDVDL